MVKSRKKVRVGLDFDGVVAYNPIRLVRVVIKWFKGKVLRKTRLSFWVPRNEVTKVMWILAHESSVFPAKGQARLRELAKREEVELHLITGRYGMLERHLMKWLGRYHMKDLFKSINVNVDCEQPHEFKKRQIERLKLDYYVDDNLDIVQYLNGKTRAKIYWIYNLADRNTGYEKKFPHLEEALKDMLG